MIKPRLFQLIKQYNWALILALLALLFGGVAIVYAHRQNPVVIKTQRTANTQTFKPKQNTEEPKPTASVSNPDLQSRSDITAPTLPPDNSVKCIAIYNKAADELNLLNAQIKVQLAIMQNIISGEQSSNSLGTMGGGTSGMLNRSHYT